MSQFVDCDCDRQGMYEVGAELGGVSNSLKHTIQKAEKLDTDVNLWA